MSFLCDQKGDETNSCDSAGYLVQGRPGARGQPRRRFIGCVCGPAPATPRRFPATSGHFPPLHARIYASADSLSIARPLRVLLQSHFYGKTNKKCPGEAPARPRSGSRRPSRSPSSSGHFQVSSQPLPGHSQGGPCTPASRSYHGLARLVRNPPRESAEQGAKPNLTQSSGLRLGCYTALKVCSTRQVARASLCLDARLHWVNAKSVRCWRSCRGGCELLLSTLWFFCSRAQRPT